MVHENQQESDDYFPSEVIFITSRSNLIINKQVLDFHFNKDRELNVSPKKSML